jgi:hypothetical protein
MSFNESFIFYFRLLILLSVGLYVVWFYGPYFIHNDHEPEITDALSWVGYGAKFSWDVMEVASHAFLFAYGVICIGLIYFKNWARIAFVFLTVISLIANLGFGLNIYTPFDAMYLQVMYMLDGFILAVIFFSSLSKHYEQTHNKRMQSDAAEPHR